MPGPTKALRGAMAAGLLLLLQACAVTVPPGAAPADPADPYEATNRDVLDVNVALDDAVLRPVAVAWRDAVPAPLRTGLRNAIGNLEEPRILANNLLQGRLLDAGHTLMRFFLNSTAGVGGLLDIAGPAGIARRTGDFGQTLDAWSVGAGPYLMLPVLGPSNPRDATGLLVDGLANPFSWIIPVAPLLGIAAVDGIGERERNIEALDELRGGSLDFYARLRSVWRQNRDAELGRVSGEGEGLSILDDPGAPAR